MSASPLAPVLPESASDELDERRLRVVAEQAVGLRWQILLTATTVTAIVWQSVPAPVVLGWFAAVIAIRELRAAALARMAADSQRPIAERLRATVRWNVLIGACNGSAALFMAWLDPSLDAVLTMILVSWGAGAVSTSATVMRAFLGYASLLFVPTALMWAMSGTWLGLGVATLVLMFFGVQIRFAKRNLETFEESFRIRLENEALALRRNTERSQLAQARDVAVQGEPGQEPLPRRCEPRPAPASAGDVAEHRRAAPPADAAGGPAGFARSSTPASSSCAACSTRCSMSRSSTPAWWWPNRARATRPPGRGRRQASGAAAAARS